MKEQILLQTHARGMKVFRGHRYLYHSSSICCLAISRTGTKTWKVAYAWIFIKWVWLQNRDKTQELPLEECYPTIGVYTFSKITISLCKMVPMTKIWGSGSRCTCCTVELTPSRSPTSLYSHAGTSHHVTVRIHVCRLSVCLRLSLFVVCLSFSLSVICLSFSLSVCLSVCLSLCLSVHCLSVACLSLSS
jgi:hypothetical protein